MALGSAAPFCRDCLIPADRIGQERCASCGSPRLLRHPERDELAVAHVDCDAFFASVEKRDNPALADQPVIIGGGHRGVVATGRDEIGVGQRGLRRRRREVRGGAWRNWPLCCNDWPSA